MSGEVTLEPDPRGGLRWCHDGRPLRFRLDRGEIRVEYAEGPREVREQPEPPPPSHRLLMSRPPTDEQHPGPFWDCPDPRCFGPNRTRTEPKRHVEFIPQGPDGIVTRIKVDGDAYWCGCGCGMFRAHNVGGSIMACNSCGELHVMREP